MNRLIIRKFIKYGIITFLGAVTLVAVLNFWVILSTSNQLKSQVDQVPINDVGLVLGTSKRLVGGEDNPYFYSRIDAACSLYFSGKIKHILVSGDNSTQFYNEPRDMQLALQEKGIPENHITLDYAGLRTLDSVVRCNKIFGQSSFTVVTQGFHAHRALFIGDYYGMNATAYEAKSPPLRFSWKVKAREILARPLAILDLYILKKNPRYGGDKVPIKIDK